MSFHTEWEQYKQSARTQLDSLPPDAGGGPSGGTGGDYNVKWEPLKYASGCCGTYAEDLRPKIASACDDTGAAATELDSWEVGGVLAQLEAEWQPALDRMRRLISSNGAALADTSSIAQLNEQSTAQLFQGATAHG
ncbi:hypothetical protein SRB5_35580 [Streptomyces sp. RB5]|uniref:Uncharacterized protein n=1 Tax=Streptomyces smaragdinus TaxID=2585196 RepID=A0A7K0CIU9_9ACTN|nr:hypothetical protein [Streptomyces smaragdinus]MQY13410.1 hypothetical protein [Streptomyces smaragdinus]